MHALGTVSISQSTFANVSSRTVRVHPALALRSLRLYQLNVLSSEASLTRRNECLIYSRPAPVFQGSGGAVSSLSALMVESSAFSSASAAASGGALVSAGTVGVSSSTFSQTSAASVRTPLSTQAVFTPPVEICPGAQVSA